MRRFAVFCAFLFLAGVAFADVSLPICHEYGCQAIAEIRYTEGQLAGIRRLLFGATDAAGEREALAQALGDMYRWAGEQSDIRNDKGGNYADDGVVGRMDCIDHSTSTTRLLALLASRGYLRWHRVLAPEERNVAGVLFIHYSAVIEETSGGEKLARADPGASAAVPAGDVESVAAEAATAVAGVGSRAARFAVDSWFVDNGQPAVILPLEEWKKGAGPDV